MLMHYKNLILATLILCFSTSVVWAEEQENKTPIKPLLAPVDKAEAVEAVEKKDVLMSGVDSHTKEAEAKTEKEVANTEVADDSASQHAKTEKKIVALTELTNLQALQEELDSQQKVLLLEFSAAYCGYCKVLERSYLKPMLTDPLYSDKVLIRKVDIDSAKPLIDFDGKEISVSDFMLRYKAGRLTPTMIFLDQTGKEVAERMIGFNTPDFFGAYLDQAIDKGVETIRKVDSSEVERVKVEKI